MYEIISALRQSAIVLDVEVLEVIDEDSSFAQSDNCRCSGADRGEDYDNRLAMTTREVEI